MATDETNLEEGSKLLITDLEILIGEAKEGAFGDFTNSKYATPKIVLHKRLTDLAENVKKGRYD